MNDLLSCLNLNNKKDFKVDFFTADLHFCHKNIVNITDRGLVTSVENHTEWLINLWNNQVKSNDTVYVLGDISFAGYNTTASILEKLNGTIIVIKGNHDDKRDLERLVGSNIINSWFDYKEIKLKETKVCMMHFPIACWNQQGYGSFHIHGHSHGSYKAEGKILDVGIDSAYNVFGQHKLFSAKEVLSIMETKQVHVKDHHKEIK